MLKESLRDAAKTSGCALEDLLDMQNDAASNITMLPSALSHKKINGSDDLVQIQSESLFR